MTVKTVTFGHRQLFQVLVILLLFLIAIQFMSHEQVPNYLKAQYYMRSLQNYANLGACNNTHEHLNGEGSEVTGQHLYEKVRILCWVLTSPDNHETKARHVKNTWGRHCNKLIFMSSKEDKELGAIAAPGVREGRDNLWGKTKRAYKYVWDNHRNEADWFFKGDDDTYVILENMRSMLFPHDPMTPIYFGCKFKFPGGQKPIQGYMSGGAGYVLSKKAVEKFVGAVEKPNNTICKIDDTGAEDAEIGICLENLNIIAGDSRDKKGRYRFNPFDVANHVFPSKTAYPEWYLKYQFTPQITGFTCCSDTVVSFHYVSPPLMYAIEYLVYYLKPVNRGPFDNSSDVLNHFIQNGTIQIKT